MKKSLFFALFLSICQYTYGQIRIESIDFYTPVQYYEDYNNPYTLGITWHTDSSNNKWFTRLAAYSGFQHMGNYYYDSELGYYSYSNKPLHQLKDGDSIRTHITAGSNKGFGLQFGKLMNFEIKEIQFNLGYYIGVYANRDHQNSTYTYTINKPDTLFRDEVNGTYWVDDYTMSLYNDQIDQTKWTIVPQLGMELAMPLELNNRLTLTPKVFINSSLQKHHPLRYYNGLSTQVVPEPYFNLDIYGNFNVGLSYSILKNK
ncbi:MAG: hypothetical protein ACPGYY_10135 [Bacteroidia bacterium]